MGDAAAPHGPADAGGQLTESSGFLIAVLGQESRRRFMAHVSQWEVGWPHQRVLSALLRLGMDGTTSQKQLGELVNVDPRNLVPIIDVLEERDLIERLPDSSDRRKSGVRLTEDGVVLTRKIQVAAAMLEQHMFAGLSPAERNTLHEILLKLYRSIEDERESAG